MLPVSGQVLLTVTQGRGNQSRADPKLLIQTQV